MKSNCPHTGGGDGRPALAGRLTVGLLLVVAAMLIPEALEAGSKETPYPMKVTFRQSGGYAGLRRGCALDTACMRSDEAESLRALVERSGILQIKGGHPSRARDATNYEIIVETDRGVHRATFDDMSVPEKVLPLLESLQDCAKPLPVQ